MLMFMLICLAGDLKLAYSGEMPAIGNLIADTFDSGVRIKMSDGKLSHGSFVIMGKDQIWATYFDPMTKKCVIEDVTLLNAERTAKLDTAFMVQYSDKLDGIIIYSKDKTFLINDKGDTVTDFKFSYVETADWVITYNTKEGPKTHKPTSGQNNLPKYLAPSGSFLSLHLENSFDGRDEVANSFRWVLSKDGISKQITPEIKTTNEKYAFFRKNKSSDVVESWSTAWFPAKICEWVLLDRVTASPDGKRLFWLQPQTGKIQTMDIGSSWKTLGNVKQVYACSLGAIYGLHARVSKSFESRSVPNAHEFSKLTTVDKAIEIVKHEMRGKLLKPTTINVIGRGEFYTFGTDLRCDPSGNLVVINYSKDMDRVYFDIYSDNLKKLNSYAINPPGMDGIDSYVSRSTVLQWIVIKDNTYLMVMQSDYSDDTHDFPRYSLYEWPKQ